MHINEPQAAIGVENIDVRFAPAGMAFADAIDAALARIDFSLLTGPYTN